jgi:DivIVA domain-containing protein
MVASATGANTVRIREPTISPAEAFTGLAFVADAGRAPTSPSKEGRFVSTTDVDLMGAPLADDLYNPEFAVVLRGYDPEEVRTYVQNVATHIDGLQRQLREAQEQVEAGRRQYMAAKEAAYKQLATHMADLLHAADMEAERLKREGHEEASKATSEAERVSMQMRREAEAEAERLRREGDEMLWRAKAETERTLGGLTAKREEMLKELEATRGRLRGVMASLESTIDSTRDETKRGAEAATVVTQAAHEEVASLAAPAAPAAVEAVEPPPFEQSPEATIDVADVEEPPPWSAEPAIDSGAPDEEEERGFASGSANGMSQSGVDLEGFRSGPPTSPGGGTEWEAPLTERGRAEESIGAEETFDLVLPDLTIDEEGEIEER